MGKFLASLKLWQKIVLVVASFGVPFGILFSYSLQSFNENLTFADLELTGCSTGRPMAELFRHLCHHQLLVQRWTGAQDLKLHQEILAEEGDFDQALRTFNALSSSVAVALDLTEEGMKRREHESASREAIATQWGALKQQWEGDTPEERDRKHADIAARLELLCAHIAESSKLALDPAADSYFLIDAVFGGLLATPRQITEVVEYSRRFLADPSPENRSYLAVKISLLKEANLSRISYGIKTSVRENAHSYGVSDNLRHELPGKLSEFNSATEKLIQYAGRIAAGDKSVGVDDVQEAGDRAENGCFDLWLASVGDVEELLRFRHRHFLIQRNEAFGFTAAALIICVALTWLVIRNINVRLRRLGELAKAAAEGDLSQTLDLAGRDEIGVLGGAFAQMVTHLSTLAGQVQRSAIVLNASVTEIAATAKQQQTTTSEVAATTTEIGATSKEIYATSKELLKTVKEVSHVAEETADLASSGHAGLARMEETMGHFVDAVGSINGKLAVLNEKAGNINQVVTTITKVADQTNLLSLNAAIEAEKAGEYGRGFSVVATEIRRLADQTAVATFDIEQMVKEMQSAVAAGVMGMDKFAEQVRRGVHDVQQVSAQLVQIIQQVQQVTPRFATVNEGMQAQATGADQITQALVQLSEAAQQTADSLRQSNASIEQLHNASRGMLSSLDGFKLRA